jgi:predicted small metal-binding protein
MKTMTCECGFVAQGASENDVVSKMQSHIHNDHADRSSEHKKMLNDAKKTMQDGVAAAA